MDNEGTDRGQSTAAGLDAHGCVKIDETTHRGDDSVRNAASEAAAKAAQALASANLKLPSSDH